MSWRRICGPVRDFGARRVEEAEDTAAAARELASQEFWWGCGRAGRRRESVNRAWRAGGAFGGSAGANVRLGVRLLRANPAFALRRFCRLAAGDRGEHGDFFEFWTWCCFGLCRWRRRSNWRGALIPAGAREIRWRGSKILPGAQWREIQSNSKDFQRSRRGARKVPIWGSGVRRDTQRGCGFAAIFSSRSK